MRLIVLLLLTIYTYNIQAQTIDTATVGKAAALGALSFTQAEKDSMLNGLKDNLRVFETMHKQAIPNDLAYPFAFHPAPRGYTIPAKQTMITWNIPANINLPKNRNEL